MCQNSEHNNSAHTSQYYNVFGFFVLLYKLVEQISKDWLDAPRNANQTLHQLDFFRIYLQSIFLIHEKSQIRNVIESLEKRNNYNKILSVEKTSFA